MSCGASIGASIDCKLHRLLQEPAPCCTLQEGGARQGGEGLEGGIGGLGGRREVPEAFPRCGAGGAGSQLELPSSRSTAGGTGAGTEEWQGE